jgi:hypothetical protein
MEHKKQTKKIKRGPEQFHYPKYIRAKPGTRRHVLNIYVSHKKRSHTAPQTIICPKG